MRVLKYSLGVAAFAALPIALAGCSSAGTSPAAPSTTSSAAGGSASASAAASSTAAADATVLTGTQLKAALVATGLPKGYSLDSSGSVDTGSSLQDPSASSGAPDCSNLGATGWVDLSGYGPVSFAQNDYIDNAASEEFAQEIDVYSGTTAQDVMTALAKMATTCPTYKDSATSSTVKISAAAGTSMGDGTVTIKLSDADWTGGTTLVAVRVGNTVVSVLNSAATGSGVTYADSLAAQLTANVKKAQAQN